MSAIHPLEDDFLEIADSVADTFLMQCLLRRIALTPEFLDSIDKLSESEDRRNCLRAQAATAAIRRKLGWAT